MDSAHIQPYSVVNDIHFREMIRSVASTAPVYDRHSITIDVAKRA